MASRNATVAHVLRRYASALATKGDNRFKIRAYRRAAETIENLGIDVATLVKQGSDLTALPGIGKAISQIIGEVVATGTLARLNSILTDLPPELAELATRPALDPAKVMRAYRKLGISSLEELRRSLEGGELRKQCGRRIEYHVRQGLGERPRSLLYKVRHLANNVEQFLRSMPGVIRVSATGSLRRKRDTVGDVGFLVTGKNASAIFRRFADYGSVLSAEVEATRAMYRLSSGVNATLHWTSPEQWGLALVLTTGSPAHLDDLQARAVSLNLPFTSEGLLGRCIDLANEKSIYDGLGLQFIAPELREGRGEVSLAAKWALPKLLEVADLRGDLHMHTQASDGAHSIMDMVAAARQRGYEYIAITDHSQSLKIANGLSEKALREQCRRIDKMNEQLEGFRVLKSAEVDILADGSLDYPESLLKELDFTVCSVHSRFSLDRNQQTDRILKAMDNPYLTILGHPTGRLLLKRDGYDVDMERILRQAQANRCLLEINSSPDRLDLSDEQAWRARELGITIAIDSDAHSAAELDLVSAGVDQARRGGLEAVNVVNTLPLPQLLAVLRKSS